MSTVVPFAYSLKQRRKALGLTQETLARRVGCATITIQKLEAAALRPSVQIAERLAEQLDLCAEERVAFLATARTLDVPPSPGAPLAALPVPPTPLIDRGPLVAIVGAVLRRKNVRLVTLIGPPGVGKTRVALQVAHELQSGFRDGAVFVSLAPLRTPELVVAQIAEALNLPDDIERPCLERVQLALQGCERLLVLDNFEQVLPAAPAIGELLAAAPALAVLVTSRAALNLLGEHQILVPPLALPDLSHLPPIADLAHVPTVELFVQRAVAVTQDFALTEANTADVAALCHRLDGLPLALELAAARCKMFTPSALLARLQQPLELLTVGARNLLPHQQTLRSALAWSYDLLSPRERALFARLGVFVGSFSPNAVSAICADDDERAGVVLDSLERLIDQSLVQHELGTTGEVRLRMLMTLRDYALEQLGEREEVALLREHHARYYVQLAQQAEEGLRGAKHKRWADLLESEHDNIRAALSWGALPHVSGNLDNDMANSSVTDNTL